MGRNNAKFSRLVIMRDKVCQECGSDSNLQAHHNILVSQGGSDNLGNGVALCAECHADRHPNVPRGLFTEHATGAVVGAKWNATSLAAVLGCCERTIVRTARKLGILKRGSHWAFGNKQRAQIGQMMQPQAQPYPEPGAERITVSIPHDLYLYLAKRRKQDGVPISTQVRMAIEADILTRVAAKHDTLEQCREYAHTRGVPPGLNVVGADEAYTAACQIIRDTPIPPRQAADEFIRGERTLEEIDDPLYGPQLRVSKLIDKPESYDVEVGG